MQSLIIYFTGAQLDSRVSFWKLNQQYSSLSKDSQLKPIQADIYNWLRLQSETDRFVRDRQQGERAGPPNILI